MLRKSALLLVAPLLVAGCETMPPGRTDHSTQYKPDKTCRPAGNCEVWVNPLDHWVPEKIIMEPGDGPRIVVWKSAFAFQNGGIQFDEAGRQAMRCEQHGPWMVVCEADPSKKGEFKYTIDVLGYDPVDPWYVNH
ncbi:MAG: hypothetical protein ACM3JC_07940 [Rudaea sp.]